MVRMKFQLWNGMWNKNPKTIHIFLHIFVVILFFVWVPVTAIKRSVIHNRIHVNKVKSTEEKWKEAEKAHKKKQKTKNNHYVPLTIVPKTQIYHITLTAMPNCIYFSFVSFFFFIVFCFYRIPFEFFRFSF